MRIENASIVESVNQENLKLKEAIKTSECEYNRLVDEFEKVGEERVLVERACDNYSAVKTEFLEQNMRLNDELERIKIQARRIKVEKEPNFALAQFRLDQEYRVKSAIRRARRLKESELDMLRREYRRLLEENKSFEVKLNEKSESDAEKIMKMRYRRVEDELSALENRVGEIDSVLENEFDTYVKDE
ncbi:hypothetical protein ACOME3_005401 [Neoechinorhynchus agilis]